MSWSQWLIMAATAVAITVPIVLLIPRARKSPAFDRLLWAGTVVMGFLGAWLVLGYAGLGPDAPIASALAPILMGTLGGALFLNLLLWVLDRITPLEIEANEENDEEYADTDEPR